MDVIRLRSLLFTQDPSTDHLNLLDQEIKAIYAVSDILLGANDSKQDVLTGLLTGEGELAGVSCKFARAIITRQRFIFKILTSRIDVRLLEISENHLNPPAPAEEPIEEPSQETEVAADEVQESPVQEGAVLGLPPTASAGTLVSALSFMQESELEQDGIAFEDSAEWVEKQDVGRSEEAPAEQDLYAGTNGTHAVHAHKMASSFGRACDVIAKSDTQLHHP